MKRNFVVSVVMAVLVVLMSAMSARAGVSSGYLDSDRNYGMSVYSYTYGNGGLLVQDQLSAYYGTRTSAIDASVWITRQTATSYNLYINFSGVEGSLPQTTMRVSQGENDGLFSSSVSTGYYDQNQGGEKGLSAPDITVIIPSAPSCWANGNGSISFDSTGVSYLYGNSSYSINTYEDYDGSLHKYWNLSANWSLGFDGSASSLNFEKGMAAAGVSISSSPAPEPASLGILALGAFGLLARRRRQAS